MSADLDDLGLKLFESLKEEFPSVTFLFENGAIIVRMLRDRYKIAHIGLNNNWVVEEDVRSFISNYIMFKQLESELIEKNSSYRGNYLLVNGPTERFVYETYDPASRDLAPDGFLGCIGIEDSSNDILLVDAGTRMHGNTVTLEVA